MSGNEWLKSLHSERMKRHGDHGGNTNSSPSSSANAQGEHSTTTSPVSSEDSGGERKRKIEVIDLIDDDDDSDAENRQRAREQDEKKQRRAKQVETDAAIARRLQQEETKDDGFDKRLQQEQTIDDGFDKLASIVIFQLVSRSNATMSLQLLKTRCGGQLSPRSVLKLGADGITDILILDNKKSQKKVSAIVDLARKWSTLPSCPTPRQGPSSSADKHFVATLSKPANKGGVEGVGKWTLNTLLEELGRTDILNADCYEVQQGVRWFTGADKRSASAVREFANNQNFRPQSMSQVSAIMRTLHQSVQVILSADGKKRKTPNPSDRAKIDRAIDHTRKELVGL